MLSKIFSILIGAILAVAFHFWKETPATISAPFAPLQDTSIAEMEITRMLQTQLEANTRAEGVPLAKRICFLPPIIHSCGDTVDWMPLMDTIYQMYDVDSIPPKKVLSLGDTIFNSFETTQMPAFSGDKTGKYYEQFIAENINWSILNPNISGRSYYQGIVNRQGRLVELKLVKSLQPDFDREALRILESMPDWLPAQKNGRFVSAQVILPVPFRRLDSMLYEPIYSQYEVEQLPQINDTIFKWTRALSFPVQDHCIPHSLFAFEVVVEKDGSVRYPRLLKQPGCDLNAQYIQHVCRMPPYTPALKNGAPVRSKTTILTRYCFR